MRAVLVVIAVLVGSPARADECSDLSSLMVSRKALTETVASWRGTSPDAGTACAVFTDLAAKTRRTILELDRLRRQCEAPAYQIPSLYSELVLLTRAEERMCRLARPDHVAAAP